MPPRGRRCGRDEAIRKKDAGRVEKISAVLDTDRSKLSALMLRQAQHEDIFLLEYN
jgi:hypothetical protein